MATDALSGKWLWQHRPLMAKSRIWRFGFNFCPDSSHIPLESSWMYVHCWNWVVLVFSIKIKSGQLIMIVTAPVLWWIVTAAKCKLFLFSNKIQTLFLFTLLGSSWGGFYQEAWYCCKFYYWQSWQHDRLHNYVVLNSVKYHPSWLQRHIKNEILQYSVIITNVTLANH